VRISRGPQGLHPARPVVSYRPTCGLVLRGIRVIGGTVKEGIHPKYAESKVVCSCGSTFTTKSTLPEIKVEVCAACHPFYTGKQKLVDTAGRVERFNRKYRRPETTK
jgi:large subunit ribosomal protein L31